MFQSWWCCWNGGQALPVPSIWINNQSTRLGMRVPSSSLITTLKLTLSVVGAVVKNLGFWGWVFINMLIDSFFSLQCDATQLLSWPIWYLFMSFLQYFHFFILLALKHWSNLEGKETLTVSSRSVQPMICSICSTIRVGQALNKSLPPLGLSCALNLCWRWL